MLNEQRIAAACEALTWWNKAGGRVYRGLVDRRAEERDLCLEGLA
jgi:GH24 family phage-related lysozyme (muramidase)